MGKREGESEKDSWGVYIFFNYFIIYRFLRGPSQAPCGFSKLDATLSECNEQPKILRNPRPLGV